MEFTRNEKKAILQFISTGVSVGANQKEMNRPFMDKLVKVLNISSENELQELKSMKDFNEDELFTLFLFGRSIEKIAVFNSLTDELGL